MKLKIVIILLCNNIFVLKYIGLPYFIICNRNYNKIERESFNSGKNIWIRSHMNAAIFLFILDVCINIHIFFCCRLKVVRRKC